MAERHRTQEGGRMAWSRTGKPLGETQRRRDTNGPGHPLWCPLLQLSILQPHKSAHSHVYPASIPTVARGKSSKSLLYYKLLDS